MKKIKVQLFGNFCMQSDTGMLSEDMIPSNQLLRLLAYMLIYRDKLQLHQDLIDIFWDNDSKNPKGALKNLIYRLRIALKELGEEDFICTHAEAYQWNPEIQVETDYEQWEKLVSELRATTDDEKREMLCTKIVSGYNGNVSNRVANESWILSKVMRYQSVYMDTVKILCGLLERQKRWVEIENYCNQAMKIDALDEDIHCLFMRSLYGQNKYDLALSHYEKVNKMFYESMGNYYPEKLRNEFQKLLAENSENASDAKEIQEELSGTWEGDGAFFCDYQVFRQIYRMEARRLKRLGIAEYVMLLTLSRKNKVFQKNAVDPVLESGMTILEEVLR